MESLKQQFERLKVCILVPTFNNAKTLALLLTDLLAFEAYIIVINDGSTDDTEKILARFPDIHSVSYYSNHGKGYALRHGISDCCKTGI